MATWQAGAAEVVVTPPVGTQLEGYGGRTAGSTGIHDELFAHALVLDDGTTRVGIVSVDILGTDRHLVKRIRDGVSERTQISPDNLFVHATHTHGGPRGLIAARPSADATLTETAARQIIGAVAVAESRLQPARLTLGTGQVAGVSQNRRHPDGPVDPTLHAIRVEGEDGTVIAALIRFTCHPTVMNFDNLQITADYPGAVNRVVKGVFGPSTVVLFANGACGDINPARHAAVFSEVNRIGTTVGAEAVRVLTGLESVGRHIAADNLLWSERPAVAYSPGRELEPGYLRSRREQVALPLRESADDEAAVQARVTAGREKLAALGLTEDQQLRARRSALAPGEVDPAILAERRTIVSRLNYDAASLAAVRRLEQLRQSATDGRWEVEIQAIRLAPGVAIVGVPGELMVELGDSIRDGSELAECLVVGYANDSVGYIVTAEAVDQGGYESGMTVFAPDGGSQLASAAAALAREVGR
ncbi:MAG TPA: neutral/alkaline non-lysosomal ceramidase N-terminal domain-containing protein [Chloroflexota bacterium]|nr:neutral/alkaline non-lysosomal ceramidase N-terminal domain-containing protein [Chloroflexota bacterium]